MRKVLIVLLCVSLFSCLGTGLVVTGDYDPMYYTPHNRVYRPYVPYYPPQQNYYYYQQYYYVPSAPRQTKETPSPTPRRLNRGRD
jgi:hypothetical protein